MEKYQKYGINPLLISIANCEEVSSISPRPTVSSLPGKYPKLVYKHIKEINAEFPVNTLRLTCKACNKSGDYECGTLVIPTPKDASNTLECFQAVGYFRCKHCNAAGEWEVPSRTKTMLSGKMIAKITASDTREVSSDIVLGQALIDGCMSPRWGSDAEEYFLEKLAANPDDAYLWNRLGNIYYKGRRPELAVVAYEQALAKDLGQIESHFSIGQILYDCRELELAAGHLRQAIAYAHQYKNLSVYELRELIVGALSILISIYNQSENELDVLPSPSELAIANFTKNEIAATSKLDFDIDPNNRDTLYPVAEVYLGARRDELQPEDRKIQTPKVKANWPLATKINKQKPSKKHKKKHK